jgi:hypothetical protein
MRTKPIAVPNALEHTWQLMGFPQRLTQPTPRTSVSRRISIPSSGII